jgi:eukaryotic-like serine/threonine-protein kinase
MSSRPDTTAAATESAEASLVGKRIQKYEVVREIGRGGMGTVYEALNTAIGKRVAMKFVGTVLAQNKDAVARFHRESQAASAVESAHIVEIFDSGFTDDDIPFLVMELLRGEDLGHRIKRCGRLELAEALHVTAQILRGLHRAHEAGIVHRDLKPDNIFLVDRDDDPNFAKILDFGISKMQRSGVPTPTLTREGTVLGTPFYMSPEQAQALPDVDGRTDLYAVGAILYECLTGHPPHSGTTYEQVIVNICMKDAPDVRMDNPAVPEPIARLIARALARERSARFSSAREFLDALVAVASGAVGVRLGRASAEDLGAGLISHGLSGRTPVQVVHGSPPLGVEPMLEVNGGGSKVGWSTSRRSGVARPRRRTLAAVAAVSLAAGLGGALLMRGAVEPTQAEATSAEIAVELRANATGARFTVDGMDLADRMLRGRLGETKRVRVEATGYTPMDKEVTLQPGSSLIEVTLDPLTPTVLPSPSVAESAIAPGGKPKAASAEASPSRPKGPGAAVRLAASNQAPKAAAAPTGVAGALQLKVD